MTNPTNATPVGSDAGTLANDAGNLPAEVSDIETSFEPQIKAGEQQAQSYESKAVSAQEEVSKIAEKSSADLTAEDQEMQHWIDNTPSRQAAYATAMHTAPIMAILTALGGKLTRLNGMQMLAATNGIVSGLNESSEKKFSDAMTAWNAAYEKMRDHQRRMADAQKLMMDAYQGRADAYQKASDAARRMTGDVLDDKQRQIAQKVDTWKAVQVAADKAARLHYSYTALNERVKARIALDAHRKKIESTTAKMPPEVKAQIAASLSREREAEKEADQLLKQRGQTISDQSMPDDLKKEKLADIDNAHNQLIDRARQAQADQDAIVAGYAATQHAAPHTDTPPPTPTTATPLPNARTGTIDRSGAPPKAAPGSAGGEAPSPGKLAELKKHPAGSSVKFGDGSTWILDADGSARRVQ